MTSRPTAAISSSVRSACSWPAAGFAALLAAVFVGATERAFQTEQARRMHLILVRRDLCRYEHLQPVQGPDGVWSARLTLPDAGVYRAFADFRTAGERRTLGIVAKEVSSVILRLAR